jgi:protein-disulfide isomerase
LNQALDQARSSGKSVDSDSAVAFAPGRYNLGPETAAVHVVAVSDYQCPSCRTIDEQLRSMIVGRKDVSVSARHFPFCTDCNEHIDKTRHPNACRAALAAEAAGIVGGADAFWQMHNWLFERRGEFTDSELGQFVQNLGLDGASFLEEIQDEKTRDLIRSDAAAADAAGLRFTPMIFINGQPINVEL